MLEYYITMLHSAIKESQLYKAINKLSTTSYPVALISCFYVFLWFVNPNNKLIAISFIALTPLLYIKLKDIRLSLFLTYFSSLIVLTGKRYLIQLIPPGVFPTEIFPFGHVIFFVISPHHILAFLMFVVLIRDVLINKDFLKRLNWFDYAIPIIFIWPLFSDTFGSLLPGISLPFSLLNIHIVIAYLFLRSYVPKDPRVWHQLIIIVAATQILIQSGIGFQQYLSSSPIYKNIELQVDIPYFGHVADELQLGFRPMGTFDHANTLGLWLTFWLSVILGQLFVRPRKSLVITLILGLFLLIITLSRSAWLGFFTSSLCIVYYFTKIKKVSLPQIPTMLYIILTPLILISLAVFIFPRAEKTLYSFNQGGGQLRTMQIQETISLIRQNPYLGVGTNMSVIAGYLHNPQGIFSKVALTIHNWYLLYALEHGIIGLLGLLTIVIAHLRRAVVRIHPHTIGYFSGIISACTIAFFQPFIGLTLIIISLAIMHSIHENKAEI